MKRRNFLKAGVMAGAAFSLNFEGLHAALASGAVSVQAAPDMVAVMGGEPEAMLDKALKSLGGIEKFVKKGQKIVIKPNIGWDRSPELAANTNPDLIKALIKRCLKAGASKVTVFDHTCDNWQKCYDNSGIAAAAKEAGAVMMPANDEKYYKKVALSKGVVLKETFIHESLIEADAWINVPVLKNHGGAKLSCAMKNYLGIVWDRRIFHSSDLQQCIADICTWEKKPVLNIVDAYRIMHQNGPQGKGAADVASLKSLIASPDIVAIDTAALGMFNQVKKLDIQAVGHIGIGEKMNLGTTDLKSKNIQRIKI
ncbi:putative Fe-S center protein [Bacteroidales bacterium Barb4]|nr:putative Fe-S center protein [Bacteroidales bacterium Barb4]